MRRDIVLPLVVLHYEDAPAPPVRSRPMPRWVAVASVLALAGVAVWAGLALQEILR